MKTMASTRITVTMERYTSSQIRQITRTEFPDGIVGLVRQAFALVSGQVQLHVGGLVVGALGSRRRERIPPEVLNVLDVLLVRCEFLDQTVVEMVGIGAERLIAFQDDHGRTVGVELLEILTGALRRLHRRRIVGGH